MTALLKSLVYQAIEIGTWGRGIERVIAGERIRFPARWCRYYPADYEPDTFAFLRQHCRSGQTVCDIGAHLGLFSIVMARLVGPMGRVFSFEPTLLTRQALQHTIHLNSYDAIVEVREEAVSLTDGIAQFHDTGSPGSNANSLVQTARSRQAMSVPTVCLDDFVQTRSIRIDCLKVDVEGGEFDLLCGARKVIRRDRPAVFLSLHPSALKCAGHSLQEVWALLQDLAMIVTRGGRLVTQEHFCAEADLFDVQLLPK